MLVSSKPFGRKCPSHEVLCKNVSICEFSLQPRLPTANSKRHAATGRPHTHPDLDLKLGKKEEKGEEDRGQLGRERVSGRENIVTVHTQNHVCLSVFF